MYANERKRRGRDLIVEGLESRHLLNGALPSPTVAEVHALKAPSVPAIKGTIHGTVTSITPLSSSSEVVTYTAQGQASIIGVGTGAGQHTITSRRLKNHSSIDTYSNGMATVVGTTDVVAVQYTGSGRTGANGTFTATLRGTATAVAGLDAGQGGSFVAQLVGSSRTGTFTITFTIRV